MSGSTAGAGAVWHRRAEIGADFYALRRNEDGRLLRLLGSACFQKGLPPLDQPVALVGADAVGQQHDGGGISRLLAERGGDLPCGVNAIDDHRDAALAGVPA
jgi:hypothetical protein